MINSIIPIKNHFPNINEKPQSLHSVFNSIKKKKLQLQKQLSNNELKEINLPSISQQNYTLNRVAPFQNQKQYQSQIIKTKNKPQNYSLLQKYRTINQMTPQQKNHNQQKISHFFTNSQIKDKDNAHQQHDKVQLRNKRIKTEIQKKKNHQIADQIKHLQEMEIEQSRIRMIQDTKGKFIQIIQTLPKSIKHKNQKNLDQTLNYLQAFNPFFNRNQRILNICLLKLGKIVAGETTKLYNIGQQLNFFYIVMLGKVKLSNGSLRKICQTGQTVLQQVMFETQLKKISLQKAKTLGHTILLEMKLSEYAKMKQELIKHGYKIGFLQMQSIIKRNYIVKNWLRNKIKQQNNK